MDRRSFLIATAPLLLPLRRVAGAVPGGSARVRFGVIADLHHGLAPDAMARLEAFVSAVRGREGLDFVIQMGDFCYAKPASEACASAFAALPVPTRHVLGNHDMDVGSKADVMGVWGMDERFSSFDAGGVHFVVLDLNHLNIDGMRVAYDDANFYVEGEKRAWADPAQLEWLAADLAATDRPTVVFAHQPLGLTREVGGALPERQEEVFRVLRGSGVVACVCGHLHVDRHEVREGIHCLCVNSASYFWRGGMHAYRDPLFAFVTIEGGVMSVEGVASVMASEEDRAGMEALREGIVGVGARISDRRMEVGVV